MLQQLELPTLQERRKHLRLSLMFKVVRGLVPALPADKYLKEITNKRQIRPKQFTGFTTNNIV